MLGACTLDVALSNKLTAAFHRCFLRDEEGRTALHFAVGYGELRCIVLLLESGASVAAADAKGNAALHYGASYGQAAATQILLTAGAKVGEKNAEGQTAADVAELNGHTEVLKLLRSAQQ